jgi:hypothetical protein
VGFGSGIAVDSSGIYLTGEDVRPDTPNTFPFDNDNGEFFVKRLSLTGQGIYTKLFGGPGTDFGSAIALDDLHNVWAVGATYTDGGPLSTGDVLVEKLDSNGNVLNEIKFGSTGEDVALGVAVSARQPWITGKTCGDGFPTTDGFVHHVNHCAAFVLQLEEAGTQNMGIIFGGVDGDDAGVAIVTNGSNDAFVTGYANSTVFPITIGTTIGTFIYPRGFVTEVSPVVSLPLLLARLSTRPYLMFPTGPSVLTQLRTTIGEDSTLPVLPRLSPSQRPPLRGHPLQPLAL